jgi:hypothetical protein
VRAGRVSSPLWYGIGGFIAAITHCEWWRIPLAACVWLLVNYLLDIRIRLKASIK